MREAQVIVDLCTATINLRDFHIYKGLHGELNRDKNCEKIPVQF